MGITAVWIDWIQVCVVPKFIDPDDLLDATPSLEQPGKKMVGEPVVCWVSNTHIDTKKKNEHLEYQVNIIYTSSIPSWKHVSIFCCGCYICQPTEDITLQDATRLSPIQKNMRC